MLIMKRINARLKAKIIEKFGTQGEFCRATGITPTQVSNVINCKKKLKNSEIRQWCRVLNCAPIIFEDII